MMFGFGFTEMLILGAICFLLILVPAAVVIAVVAYVGKKKEPGNNE